MTDSNPERVLEKLRFSLQTSNNVCVESNMETINQDMKRKGKKPRVKLVPVLIPVIDYDDSDSNDSNDDHDKSQVTLPNIGSVTLKTPKNIQDLSTFKLLKDSQFSPINPLHESATNSKQCNSLYVLDKDGKSKSKVTLPPGMTYNTDIKDNSKTYNRITKVTPKTPISVIPNEPKMSHTTTNITGKPRHIVIKSTTSEITSEPKMSHTTTNTMSKPANIGPKTTNSEIPSEPKTFNTTTNTTSKPRYVGPNIITIRKQEPPVHDKYKTKSTQCSELQQEEMENDVGKLKIVSLMSGHEQVCAAMTGSFLSTPDCDLTVRKTRSYSRKNPVVTKLVDKTGEAVRLTNLNVVQTPNYNKLNAEKAKSVDLKSYVEFLSEFIDFPKSTVETIAKLNLSMSLNKFRRAEFRYIRPLENGEITCPVCEKGFPLRAALRKHVMVDHGIDSAFQFPKLMGLIKIFTGQTLYQIEELKHYRNVLDEILNYPRWKTKKRKSIVDANKTDKTVLNDPIETSEPVTKTTSEIKKANQTNTPKTPIVPSNTPSTSSKSKPPLTTSVTQWLRNHRLPSTISQPNIVLISGNYKDQISDKHLLAIQNDVMKKIDQKSEANLIGNKYAGNVKIMSTTKSMNLRKKVDAGVNKAGSGTESNDDEFCEDAYEMTKRSYFRSFKEIPKEKYFCNICPYKCEEVEVYFNHRLSHIPQAQCPLCLLFLPGITGLFTHLEAEHNSESGLDDENNLVITSKNDKDGKQLIVPESHYQPTEDQVTIEYHCQGCGFFTLEYEIYLEHVKSEHTKPCNCKICNQAFNHELEMIEHMKICEVQQKYVFNSEKYNRKDCGPYTCSYCHRVFEKKGIFMIHLAKHNVDRYFCVFCKEGFFKKAILKKHYADQHEFGCNKCKVEFTNTKDLWNHRFKHEKKYVLVCEFCGKSFNNKAYYRDHLNWHKGIKTHTCKFCGEKFSYYTALEVHRYKVHADQLDKSYLCSHCGIQYKVHKRLYNHIRLVHEGVKKPHEMGPMKDPNWRKRKRVRKNFGPSAPRRIRDATTGKLVARDSLVGPRVRRRIRDPVTGNLVSRENISKPPPKRRFRTSPRKKRIVKETLDCEHCGNGFSLPSELWKHVETHKEVSNYQCQYCQLYFTSPTNLFTHIEMKYCGQITTLTIDSLKEEAVTDSDEDYAPPKKMVRVFYTKSNEQPTSASSSQHQNYTIARPTILKLEADRGQVVYATDPGTSTNGNFEEEISLAIDSVVETEPVVTESDNVYVESQVIESVPPVGGSYIIVSQNEHDQYPNFNYYQEFI